MHTNTRRSFKSKITFRSLLRIYVVFSLILGGFGLWGYLKFREKRALELIAERERLEQLQLERERQPEVPHITVVPPAGEIIAGEEIEFRVELRDAKAEALIAAADTLIRIRPEPKTFTYRYTGESTKEVTVKKGRSAAALTYTETKAGEYTLTVSADGFADGEFKLKVLPRPISSLSIIADSELEAGVVRDGVMLKSVAKDKYKNTIEDGYNWYVSKNEGAEISLGSTKDITYTDGSAVVCDYYEFRLTNGSFETFFKISVVSNEKKCP